jgi:hypothetical protein
MEKSDACLEKNAPYKSLLKESFSDHGEEGHTKVEDVEDNNTIRKVEQPTQTLATVVLLVVWLATSCGLVMSNKYILYTLKFTYPAILTCWHQICAAATSWVAIYCITSQSVTDRPQITQREYFCVILPIAGLFALSLIFNNMPYLSLSVSFIQMLKGLGPATAFLAMWSLGLQPGDKATCLNIGIVVAGAVVSSLGEVKFELKGFLYQICGLLFDGYRLGLTRKLLSSEKNMEPLVAMGYMAPPSAFMLGLIAVTTEWQGLKWEEVRNVGVLVFLINGCGAVFLNLIVFRLVSSHLCSSVWKSCWWRLTIAWQISRTRPLTLPLCAELKKVIIVAGSMAFWGDTVTIWQLIGYMITSMGLLLNSVGNETIREHVKAKLGNWPTPLRISREQKSEAAIALVSKVDC